MDDLVMGNEKKNDRILVMREKIMILLAESIGLDGSLPDADADPVKTYEMDSVMILDFVIRIEDEYGIDFQDFSELSNHMNTVGEMADYMMGMIEGGSH